MNAIINMILILYLLLAFWSGTQTKLTTNEELVSAGGLLRNKVPNNETKTRFQIRNRGMGVAELTRGEIVSE